MSASPGAAGPATHYELFAGLRDAGVAYLLTGATALVLHGVPRLTPDVDLAVDPEPENLRRLEQLLTVWGYGTRSVDTNAAAGISVSRWRHPSAALGEIDIVLPDPAAYARLRSGASVATLVDVGIPFLGAADLRAARESDGSVTGREDAPRSRR